uniref:BAR domain-containing protein n=1 Tax=Erythrolobus australicus TaxID=1077150 RepID=A0A7S1XHB9_9RHOD|mmetsp:Transcript_2470/g.6675  ORF Transcript_2470/g.6675 Transcript_2470/m.6675 type:complete len:257 (+) Transcript_2470:246-1016(+)
MHGFKKFGKVMGETLGTTKKDKITVDTELKELVDAGKKNEVAAKALLNSLTTAATNWKKIAKDVDGISDLSLKIPAGAKPESLTALCANTKGAKDATEAVQTPAVNAAIEELKKYAAALAKATGADNKAVDQARLEHDLYRDKLEKIKEDKRGGNEEKFAHWDREYHERLDKLKAKLRVLNAQAPEMMALGVAAYSTAHAAYFNSMKDYMQAIESGVDKAALEYKYAEPEAPAPASPTTAAVNGNGHVAEVSAEAV